MREDREDIIKERAISHIQLQSDRVIGIGQPTFIIAEIGSNHDQDLNKARQLIAEIAACGADAVKFQSLDFAELYPADAPDETRQLYERIKLDTDWYPTLFATAREHGLIPMSCPTYFRAVDDLLDQKIELFKIASPQTLAFPQLLERVAATGVPTVVSTGYCDGARIKRAVDIFARFRCPIVLLHCNSQYPVPAERVGLKYLVTLRERFNVHTGFSDHTEGMYAPLAAVTLGARVLERHVTYSRLASGPDHHFAAELADFARLVAEIRDLEKALTPMKVMTEDEINAGKTMRMAVFARRDLQAGKMLTTDDVRYFRHAGGLSAEDVFDRPMPLRLRKAVKAGTLIDRSLVEDS
jgi:sialic acid synthase SpsE